MSFPDNDRTPRPVAPDWKRFRRPGDFWRNPIIIGVVIVLVSNVMWAAAVYAWQAGNEAVHNYWKSYGAGIAAEAQYTNDPDKLRGIIARVQSARAR